jgi:hypothetical protein
VEPLIYIIDDYNRDTYHFYNIGIFVNYCKNAEELLRGN